PRRHLTSETRRGLSGNGRACRRPRDAREGAAELSGDVEMPFDGKESPNLLALAKLGIARDLVSDPRRWCKGSLINAAGARGILGALRRADAEEELKPLILSAAREITGRSFRSIERF